MRAICRDGKEIWKSLRTTLFSIAEAKLATMQKEQREHCGETVVAAKTRMTFGQAAMLHMQRIEDACDDQAPSRQPTFFS